jgi:hypothetical protein
VELTPIVALATVRVKKTKRHRRPNYRRTPHQGGARAETVCRRRPAAAAQQQRVSSGSHRTHSGPTSAEISTKSRNTGGASGPAAHLERRAEDVAPYRLSHIGPSYFPTTPAARGFRDSRVTRSSFWLGQGARASRPYCPSKNGRDARSPWACLPGYSQTTPDARGLRDSGLSTLRFGSIAISSSKNCAGDGAIHPIPPCPLRPLRLISPTDR